MWATVTSDYNNVILTRETNYVFNISLVIGQIIIRSFSLLQTKDLKSGKANYNTKR